MGTLYMYMYVSVVGESVYVCACVCAFMCMHGGGVHMQVRDMLGEGGCTEVA